MVFASQASLKLEILLPHPPRCWNYRCKIKSPKTDPLIDGYLICNKGSSIIYWEKDDLFNNWC
jgi:hypothetical protein